MGEIVNYRNPQNRDFDNVDYMSVNLQSQSTKITTHRFGRSLSTVGMFWVILSIFCAFSCAVAFIFPFWLKGHLVDPSIDNLIQRNFTKTSTYFGLWRRCNYYVLNAETMDLHLEFTCGRYQNLEDVPSFWWTIAAFLMFIGCIISVFVVMYSVCACCIRDILPNCFSRILGCCQFIAGMCVLLSPRHTSPSLLHD